MLKQSLIAGSCILMFSAASHAQTQSAGASPKPASSSSLITRMMAFDANKDGKLTKDEITDERLMRLFEEADTNKDGVVTREELTALSAKLDAEVPAGGGRGGPGGFGGPDGFDGPPGGGGPDGQGRGGPGGPGGRGGPPQPGQVLPPMLQDALNLTDDQKKQVADLQKDVDTKLAKILTADQLKQMKQMRGRGPGGPG